ncbi:MAG: allophanate hydrolase [Actinobacteria bacterium]|nr:allophanate hydrolase [Actinomycetota bacterium]
MQLRARAVAGPGRSNRVSGDDGVWITRCEPEDVAAAGAAVDPSLPLAGRTMAVKDNIDVAGLPTTAGCPAFAYRPATSAPIVQRLIEAGAVVVGKTNLDQFATGLTGSRSPYGIGRSVVDPSLVSGGSSSGSAIAVAAGLADFALGTDTAGSGRVPAACNGIIGYKPTPGLLPIDGIVPACRSIDCPSVFTRTVAEAREVLAVLAPQVPLSPFDLAKSRLRVAVPDDESLSSVHPAAREAFEATVARLQADVVVVNLGDFFAVGDLLYGGSWVAERYLSFGHFLEDHPDQVNEVVASIVLGARRLTAVDAFADRYRLEELAIRCGRLLAAFDVLVTPTVPDVPTTEAVAADPVGTNAALGRFTTFANLLGLAAVAIPDAGRHDGVPSGVSVLAPGGADHLVLDVASVICGEPPGPRATGARDSEVDLAVVGAHLTGQPLNHQLRDRGAVLRQRTSTASHYRLHALDTIPPKPGLERVADGGGAAIEVEVWSLPAAGFGSFVASVPAPLAIGKLELDDGTWVEGFVCEPHALAAAADITSFGGWRRYLASLDS